MGLPLIPSVNKNIESFIEGTESFIPVRVHIFRLVYSLIAEEKHLMVSSSYKSRSERVPEACFSGIEIPSHPHRVTVM